MALGRRPVLHSDGEAIGYPVLPHFDLFQAARRTCRFRRFSVPDLKPNCLVLNIQPEQGVTLSIGAKVPGPQVRIRNVDMEFEYDRTFKERSPEAYEHLLLEAIAGDTTMFTRDDEVESAWRIVTAIRDAWDQGAVPIHPYPAGSMGPSAKNKLLGSSRTWNGG